MKFYTLRTDTFTLNFDVTLFQVPAESGSVRLYQPLDDAVDEFQVERIEVIAGQTVTTPVLGAPAILVCCTAPDGVGQGTIAAIQEEAGQVGQAGRDVGAGKAVAMAGEGKADRR